MQHLKPKPQPQVGGVVSKVLSDFLMVHTCLISTLVGSWIRTTEAASQAVVLASARGTVHEYLSLVLPLSLVFPTAFFLSGFYREHGTYSLSHRVMVLFRGIAIGLTMFLTACLLFVSGNVLGFRSLAFFSVALFVLLSSARVGEWAVARQRKAAPLDPLDDARLPVLVIGGAGYIGSILVRKLLNLGRRVRVLDSLVYGDGALRDVINHPGLELSVRDWRNLRTEIRAVKGVYSIIHLAAMVGDPSCAQDCGTALEINYAATAMLIEVAKGAGIKRFLFASSCSVYGASEELMQESSSVNPISVYAQTKVDSEKALLEARNSDFQPTILRLATVFGLSPRPRFDLVVNLLTAKACKGDPITIFNGEQWRPFIHVDDVAEGFVKVLNAPLELVGGEVFNLGDSKLNYTLTQVSEKIIAMFPGAKVEHKPATDLRNYRVSFEKVFRRLGFECSRGLHEGIQEIKEAIAQSRILDYMSYQYNNQKFLELAGSPSNQDEIDENVMAAFAQARSLKRAAANGL